MGSLNNPAGRLLAVLERAKAQQQQLQSKSAYEAWTTLLGVTASDQPRSMRAIGHLMELPQEIQVAVQKLSGIHPGHLVAWIPKFVEPWRNVNLGASFSNFLNPVDDTMLSLLRICDDMLARQQPEPIAPEEQLKKIHQQVTSLAIEIAGAEMEESFKKYLLHFLEIIDAAISDYRLKGFKALKAGLEQCIGALRLEVRHKEDFRSQPFGKKVLTVLAGYALVVASVADSLEIPHEIKSYLPAPAGTHSLDQAKASNSQSGNGKNQEYPPVEERKTAVH